MKAEDHLNASEANLDDAINRLLSPFEPTDADTSELVGKIARAVFELGSALVFAVLDVAAAVRAATPPRWTGPK